LETIMAIGSIAIAAAALAAAALWARADYKAWLALGPGGLPATPKGWWRTTCWRLQKRDPFSAKGFADSIGGAEDRAFLGSIPARVGPRPKLAPWPVPHRQLDQFPEPTTRPEVQAIFDRAVEARVAKLQYQLSYFEKRHPAIFLCEPASGHVYARCSHGEVAHIHPDVSMHMIMSPSDCRTAIDRGWGELHPLCGVHPELPPTYLFVYPPRNDAELAILNQLLEASIAHMTLAGGGTATAAPAPNAAP
jgi:hypothetical protein